MNVCTCWCHRLFSKPFLQTSFLLPTGLLFSISTFFATFLYGQQNVAHCFSLFPKSGNDLDTTEISSQSSSSSGIEETSTPSSITVENKTEINSPSLSSCCATETGLWKDSLPEYSPFEIRKHRTVYSRIWVAYKSGVYDITSFHKQFPEDAIELQKAAGRDCQPFLMTFTPEMRLRIISQLEQYRIGNVDYSADSVGGKAAVRAIQNGALDRNEEGILFDNNNKKNLFSKIKKRFFTDVEEMKKDEFLRQVRGKFLRAQMQLKMNQLLQEDRKPTDSTQGDEQGSENIRSDNRSFLIPETDDPLEEQEEFRNGELGSLPIPLNQHSPNKEENVSSHKSGILSFLPSFHPTRQVGKEVLEELKKRDSYLAESDELWVRWKCQYKNHGNRCSYEKELRQLFNEMVKAREARLKREQADEEDVEGK